MDKLYISIIGSIGGITGKIYGCGINLDEAKEKALKNANGHDDLIKSINEISEKILFDNMPEFFSSLIGISAFYCGKNMYDMFINKESSEGFDGKILELDGVKYVDFVLKEIKQEKEIIKYKCCFSKYDCISNEDDGFYEKGIELIKELNRIGYYYYYYGNEYSEKKMGYIKHDCFPKNVPFWSDFAYPSKNSIPSYSNEDIFFISSKNHIIHDIRGRSPSPLNGNIDEALRYINYRGAVKIRNKNFIKLSSVLDQNGDIVVFK